MQQTSNTGIPTRIYKPDQAEYQQTPLEEDDAWLNDVAITQQRHAVSHPIPHAISYEDVPTLPLARTESVTPTPQKVPLKQESSLMPEYRLWPLVQPLSAQLWREVHRAGASANPSNNTSTTLPSVCTLQRRALALLRNNLALARQLKTKEEMQLFLQRVVDEVVGAGPLEHFLRDDKVTTILVFHTMHTTVERDGQVQTWNNLFADEQHLHRIVENLLRHSDQQSRSAWPLTGMLLLDQIQLTIAAPQVDSQKRYLVFHYANTHLSLNSPVLLMLLKIH